MKNFILSLGVLFFSMHFCGADAHVFNAEDCGALGRDAVGIAHTREKGMPLPEILRKLTVMAITVKGDPVTYIQDFDDIAVVLNVTRFVYANPEVSAEELGEYVKKKCWKNTLTFVRLF